MQYDTIRTIKHLMDVFSSNNDLNFSEIYTDKNFFTDRTLNNWLYYYNDLLGVYRLKNEDVDYGFLLTNWRGDDVYYIIVCDNKQNGNATLEIRTEEKGYLLWKYSPRLRDKKNVLRKQLFKEEYGDCTVIFDIPKTVDDIKAFLLKIIHIAELKTKVHLRDVSKNE